MVDIVKGIEGYTQELQGQALSIKAVQLSGATKNSGTVPEKPCHCCGKNPLPHQCHFKDAVCHSAVREDVLQKFAEDQSQREMP